MAPSAPMTAAMRDQFAREAMFAQAPIIDGVPMRRMTGGSIDLARYVGITFIDNPETLDQMAQPEAHRQILTFLFIHGWCDSAHEGDVIKNFEAVCAMVSEADFRIKRLIPFSVRFDFATAMSEVARWIIAVRKRALVAEYEITAKPDDPPDKDLPPN